MSSLTRVLGPADVGGAPFVPLLRDPFQMVELELGCAYGDVLERLAAHAPDRHFVGVDILARRCTIAASRVIERAGLTNVSVVNMEGYRFLQLLHGHSPAGAVAAIHVYFPTPNQRCHGPETHAELSPRLVDPAFLRAAHRALRDGGSLRLMTDCPDYFASVCRSLSMAEWWIVDWEPIALGQPAGHMIGSPCEIGYRAEGREIFALQLRPLRT